MDDPLLQPISPDEPGGADLALAPELDDIRAARQGDEAGLAQGDWVRELRAPQWPRVRELCGALLRERSKDLQVACWHAEALAWTESFRGLARGLGTVEGLLDRFWDSCHPALEDGSAEARAGRIQWLDSHLAETARQLPLTAPAAGGFTWLACEQSRRVDNLALRDPEARDEAIREGQLTGEAFQKAVLASGPGFYQELQDQTRAALDAVRSLAAVLERRFGPQGPDLGALAETLGACAEFAAQTRQRLAPAGPPGTPAPEPPMSIPAAGRAFGARAEAIRSLRAAAAFFRGAEPHSPVAFLVERAANWAEMPLDAWLAEVIKDGPTLAQLRELLDLKRTSPVAAGELNGVGT